ncbi:MAG: hypothetical protein ACYCQJ_00405 [Nitrososphaerales archaeon]
MKYKCSECLKTFENQWQADTHQKKTGHRVELNVATTYWGQHLIA